MKRITVAVTVIGLSAILMEPLSAQRPLSVRQIAAAARPAVVTIQVNDGNEFSAYGIGFLIRDDGVIVTSLSVVAGVDRIRVELESGEIYDTVHVLGHDERRDMLLLKIPATDLPWLEIADDRAAYVGDAVYAVGNPVGSDMTFSDGILSAKQLYDGVVQLQTTATMSNGSSGGPILDVAGQVIGVASISTADDENMSIAVPARYAQGLLAFAGERVPFPSFAAELNRSTYGLLAARARESRRLMEAFPANVRAELESLDPLEQQLAVRQTTSVTAMTAAGWLLFGAEESDYLETGGNDSMSVRLASGRYHAIGRCDDSCGDLDVIVWDADGRKVGEDVGASSAPEVAFSVRRRDTYRIDTSMGMCSRDTCRYGIQLFHTE